MAEGKELINLVESFYSRFVLRDLFGKILPGFIALFGVGLFVGRSPQQLATFAKDMPTGFWIVGTGLAWLAGMGVQGVGEITYMFRDAPASLGDRSAVYKYLMRFREVQEEGLTRTIERLTVIKEACGIGSVALLLLLVAFTVSVGCDALTRHRPLLLSLTVGMLLLQYMHRRHLSREYLYRDAILESMKPTCNTPSPEPSE